MCGVPTVYRLAYICRSPHPETPVPPGPFIPRASRGRRSGVVPPATVQLMYTRVSISMNIMYVCMCVSVYMYISNIYDVRRSSCTHTQADTRGRTPAVPSRSCTVTVVVVAVTDVQSALVYVTIRVYPTRTYDIIYRSKTSTTRKITYFQEKG